MAVLCVVLDTNVLVSGPAISARSARLTWKIGACGDHANLLQGRGRGGPELSPMGLCREALRSNSSAHSYNMTLCSFGTAPYIY